MSSTAVPTHCPYCALQCATLLTPAAAGDADQDPVTVAPRDFPTNRGGLCQKGWTAAAVLRAGDRITAPHVRGVDGRLRPTTWDAALALVATRLTDIRQRHGNDAVAVFGGGGLTNEKAYALGKFTRVVLGSRMIDYNGRFCMSSAAAGANRSLGIDRGLPFPLEDVGHAPVVLLVGSNIAETMPPAVTHLSRARGAGGLLVIDPRRSATAALTADGAGLHLQPSPGTDLALLQGLLHVVVHEGLLDETYVAERTTGFEDVRRSLSTAWPELTERTTGVPADHIRDAARMLASGAPVNGGAGAVILTGRGAEQHANGTDTVTACINLALALGLPGRRSSGYGCLTGQGNGQGGREHGQKADQLPGYRRIDDPAARAHVAEVWGVHPDSLPGPGVSAVELLQSVGTHGGPRALLVHGSNVVVSAPNAGAVAERLRALELLVVCDTVPSETALLADVLLPVTQWAEEEGTMTTLEGRVVRRRRAIPPPEGARSDLRILADLAQRLGRPGVIDADPRGTFDELARASAGGPADYSAISYDRLDAGEALFWPCSPAIPAGTPRLFADSFPTPDGRARFLAVAHRPPVDDLREDAPLYLTTGRVLQHYQSGAQTRRVPELVAASPEPFVEIHPDTARGLGVEEGDLVRVSGLRGDAVAVARVTASMRPDTVFMPFHWSGPGSANLVTNDALDPVSRMPEFKVCAVSVTREEVLA